MGYSIAEIVAITKSRGMLGDVCIKQINPCDLFAISSELTGNGLIIDTETTDITKYPVEILDVSFLPFLHVGNEIIEVGQAKKYYNLPKHPENITEKITKLTGYTYEKIKKLCKKKEVFTKDILVKNTLNADLIISHNASFDKQHIKNLVQKKFIDKYNWVDSMDIDWNLVIPEAGINKNNNKKLEVLFGLSGKSNEFLTYQAHDSINDCYALLFLLTKGNALKQLLEPKVKITVSGWVSHDFYYNVLKSNHFKFCPETKTSSKIVKESDALNLIELIGTIADQKNPNHTLVIKKSI